MCYNVKYQIILIFFKQISINNYYNCVEIDRVVKLIHGTKKGVFFGANAIESMNQILDDLKLKNIFVVTGRNSYKANGLWDKLSELFAQKKLNVIHYDKVSTNPTSDAVNEATQLFKSHYNYEDTAILCIGGGSPIDAGKSVAVLLENQPHTCEELYKFQFTPTNAARIITVDTTHGTGSSANRFAVVSLLNEPTPYKPAIAYEYSSLYRSMSKEQTLLTSIDAINHCMEASTTTITSIFSQTLAKEVSQIVDTYLPIALNDNNQENVDKANYLLGYAAYLGGVSFDQSFLHICHALEHTLSAFNNISHGAGLALLQPIQVKLIWENEASRAILQSCFEPIFGKQELTPQEAANKMRSWLVKMGFTGTMEKYGFKKELVDQYVKATFECPGMQGLLDLAPVKMTSDKVKQVFTEAFDY